MIHAQIVPIFDQQVRALLGQLDKAAAWCAGEGIAEGDLLDTRLAPDMFPLAKQLDFVVAQLLQPLRRLTGLDLAEPAQASPTIADHQRRLREALAYLPQIDAEQVDRAPDRIIGMDLPNGMSFDLGATAYVRDWALPQFWFHLVCAYAIMRMRGVPLGKADFVPHMIRHLRPTAG